MVDRVYPKIYLPDQLCVKGAVDDVYFVGADNRKYLDLLSGGGAFFLWRYGDKSVKRILSSHFISTSNFLQHKSKGLLASELSQLTGFPLVYFLCSGSEAIDAAIKMAYKYHGGKRKKVGKVRGSYHGRTGLSVRCGPEGYSSYLPDGKDFITIESASILGGDFAAVIIEGCCPQEILKAYDDEALRWIVVKCIEHDIVLIADEVRSGLGRTGYILSSETWSNGLDFSQKKPDIVVIGKSLCAGFPLSAVLMREKFYDCIDKDWHSSTAGGHPMLCELSRYLLSSLGGECLTEIAGKSWRMGKELDTVFPDIEYTQFGLWWNLFVDDAFDVSKKLRIEGVLVYCTSDDSITLFPSMHFTMTHWTEFLAALNEAI